jgi:cleavage and polyadenylation specificity factor subunit 1
MFIGSEDADSAIIGWSRKSKQSTRRQSQANGDDMDLDASDLEDLEDEDDLYGEAPAIMEAKDNAAASRVGDYTFTLHDSLLNIAPIKSIAIAAPETADKPDDTKGALELVGICNRGSSGSLAIMKSEIEPNVIGKFDFSEARGVWTVSVKKSLAKDSPGDKTKIIPNGGLNLEAEFDNLMIVSKATDETSEESAVYGLTGAGFEEMTKTEFDPGAGETIEVGAVGDGMRIVQVLKSEVRCYDGGKQVPFYCPVLPFSVCYNRHIGHGQHGRMRNTHRHSFEHNKDSSFHSINGRILPQTPCLPCSLCPKCYL